MFAPQFVEATNHTEKMLKQWTSLKSIWRIYYQFHIWTELLFKCETDNIWLMAWLNQAIKRPHVYAWSKIEQLITSERAYLKLFKPINYALTPPW